MSISAEQTTPLTRDELLALLTEQFPGADIVLDEGEDHRIFGKIQWDGFQKVELADRNRMVMDQIRLRFGLRGKRLGVLYTLVPGERLDSPSTN